MENKEYLKQILPKLAKQMPYKWRVQSFSKNKEVATCVAYIDARDVMDRLDEVCEYGWERTHAELKSHLYAGLGIMMPDGCNLTRWDCGTESNTEAEKGESSDSFKRAAVNWGVGRFLYDLKILTVKSNEKKTNANFPFVVDDAGRKVWDVTKHCNTVYDKANPEQEEETPKAPVTPKAPEPQMTEDQKNVIIKHASLIEIFPIEERERFLLWAAKPQTFENAKRTINRNESIITEKMKPVTA